MIHVHLAGELVKAPMQKTGATAKPFAVLVVKAGNSQDGQIVTALAFGEHCEAAMQLEKGDSVSLVGRGSLGIYEAKDGTKTPSLSVIVSALLSGRKTARKAKQDKPAPTRTE